MKLLVTYNNRLEETYEDVAEIRVTQEGRTLIFYDGDEMPIPRSAVIEPLTPA